MSKASDNSNAVVYAAGQVLDLYGVRYTREQSRVIQVEGAAGRWRPMSFGLWIDDNGKTHRSGKADLLARPRVLIYTGYISVPLWIECKSGKGTMTTDQRAFKKWVEANGDNFLLIHDDVRPLVDWLEARNVKKEPKRVIHAGEPLSVAALHALPCRHKGCGLARDQHKGTILACPTVLGKVWSPRLKLPEAK